jgi:ankyrin repeat protein
MSIDEEAWAGSSPAQEELFELLDRLRRTTESNPPLPASLTEAAMKGDLPLVEHFLAQGSKINERTRGYASPLQAACAEGQLAATELLISRGADLSPGTGLFSPLDSAARHGHPALVRLLLDAGVPATSVDALRALVYATAAHHLECIRILVEAGVPVDSDNEAHSALATAREAEQSDLTAYLTGAIDYATLVARTPVEEPAPDSASALNDLFDQLGLIGHPWRKPRLRKEADRLQAEERACELVRSPDLQNHLDEPGRFGCPALVLAADQGLARLVDALLEAGADPDAVSDTRGASALQEAAGQGDQTIVDRLLAAGAALDRADARGETALFQASRRGDLELVRHLLARGADPRTKNNNGSTAARYAQGPYRKDIERLLRETAKPR